MQSINVRMPQPTASPELRERCRRLVDEVGAPKAAAQLGVSRQTLASIIAGMNVHRSTLLAADTKAPR
jgi:hypothetical protein